MKKLIKQLKLSVKNRVLKIKTKVKKSVQSFKVEVAEVKKRPISKRRAWVYGVATVCGIFGLSSVLTVLPAVAKDSPNIPAEQQTDICPSSSPGPTTSAEITKAVQGMAATVCGLAVSTGSFAVGIGCGIIIVIGILHVQNK